MSVVADVLVGIVALIHLYIVEDGSETVVRSVA